MKYALYIAILIILACIFFQIKSCAGASQAVAAATKNKDSLMVVIGNQDSTRKVQQTESQEMIDSLEWQIAFTKFNDAKARTQFEGTGGAIVKENTQYKAAKVVHDTIALFSNCDSMSANVDQAHGEYLEMQRQRDSVVAELEFISAAKTTRIDTLLADVQADSTQKQDLSHDFDIVKKAKKGFWGWVAAAAMFVLLILKK